MCYNLSVRKKKENDMKNTEVYCPKCKSFVCLYEEYLIDNTQDIYCVNCSERVLKGNNEEII